MSLVVASVVKNEMRRFWPRTLRTWKSFADDLVIVDDGSEDETKELALREGAHVLDSSGDGLWGDETPTRRLLFEAAWEFAKVDDYILWLDGDMTPARDPCILTETGADGVVFRLYDLWHQDPRGRFWFRSDDFWRGHLHGRLWMVRKTPKRASEFSWSGRGIHSGHLPIDFPADSYAYAPEDFSLLHFAYISEELRQDKYVEYAQVSSDLTDFERAHARSILDESPKLLPLPFKPELTLT